MAKGVFVSFLIIAIGAAWLLTVLNVIRGVDWIWTIALAAAGVATLALGKVNKLTFVVGSFLVVASILSVMRQTGMLKLDVEVPVLVMILGVITLIAQLPQIPHTQAYVKMKEQQLATKETEK